MQRITLTIDQRLAASLREEAKRDDRPVSSVARKALSFYFSTTPPRRAPKNRRAPTNLNHA